MYKKISMFIYILSICVTAFPSATQKVSAEEEKITMARAPQGPARFLAIFLNESEFRGLQELDIPQNATVSAELSKALMAKSFPILVSASLFTAVVTKREWFDNRWTKTHSFLDSAVNEDFTQMWQDLTKTQERSVDSFLSSLQVPLSLRFGIAQDLRNLFYYRTLYDSNWQAFGVQPLFNFDEWEIRGLAGDMGDILYLLVPKTYLHAIGCTQSTRSSRGLVPEDPSITACEKALGLKIDHMDWFDWKHIMQVFTGRKHPATDKEQEQRNIMTTSALLAYVFVPRDAYTGKDTFPGWVIYATGHGSQGEQIMSLGKASFGLFLDALAATDTKALFINSCFAGGGSVQTALSFAANVYKDKVGERGGNPYPFPIIIQSINETETYLAFDAMYFNNVTAADIDWATKTFKPIRLKGREFGQVAAELQKRGPLNFEVLQKLLFPPSGIKKIADIAQIIEPGEAPKLLRKGTFNISEEFALGRRAKLILPEPSSAVPLTTLALNTDVFFDIEINTPDPIDIFTVGGFTYVFLQKVATTKNWGIAGILQSFVKGVLEDKQTSRVISIDEVEGPGKKICTNVIIALNFSLEMGEKQANTCIILLTCNGKLQVVQDCSAKQFTFRDATQEEKGLYYKMNFQLPYLKEAAQQGQQKRIEKREQEKKELEKALKEGEAQRADKIAKALSTLDAQLKALTQALS